MAMIICQYSFGQGVTLKEALEGMSTLYQRDGISHDFHTSHISEDAAYEAPNSALTKKWFFRNINEYVDDYPGYIQFFPNGTLKMYWEGAGIYAEIPGKWQRSKQDLKLSFNYPMAKCNSKDLSGYSLREKDNINKGIAEIRAIYRKSKVETESRKILRMDDLMVLDIKNGLCAYLVSEEYLVNKAKTKAEEEARKAEEAKKREAEEAARAAKEAEEIRTGTKIYNIDEVEKKPSFPGDKLYMYWVSDNVKYPEAAKKIDESNKYSNMKMKVRARFVIERDGSISNIEIIYNQGTEFYGEEIGRMFSDEAIRVLNSMPKWIPGEQNGASARVRITFCPIEFKY